jgi:predicted phosphodiesterase
MTALATADWHLTDNPRDDYRFKTLAKLPAIMKHYGVKQLLILGDITDSKDRHGAWLVNAIVTLFYDLSRACDQIIVMRGNHDGSDPNNPFFEFIERIKGMTWINEPTEMLLHGVGECLFLPHTSDYQKDWRTLAFDGYDFIFAHNTFKGAISESGRDLDGIPVDVFPLGVPVISGDVHVPQRIQAVTYVGAPYSIDFGDAFRPRMLLLDHKKPLYSIPIIGAQKCLIRWPLTNDDFNRGDIVKVQVDMTALDYANWHAIRRDVLAWAELEGLRVWAIQPVAKAGVARQHTRLHIERKSDHDVMLEYAKRRDIDASTLKTGLELCDQNWSSRE